MKLKSFGCSFVYGNDLSDCPHGTGDDNPPPSSLTWPALIATRINAEYECYARPAAGNLQILETVLSNISNDSEDFYIINWSWIDRFSYFSEKFSTRSHPWNPNGWTSILPAVSDHISENYYKNLHSQMRDKLESLICIKTAVDALQQSGKKFLMTYTDGLIWETQWHTTPAIIYLQNSISPHVSGFENVGFLEWAKSRDFAISDKMHPLEDAHFTAADLFIDAIRRII